MCPTPLTEACISGCLPTVELLLEYGADVNLREIDEKGTPTEGTSPLRCQAWPCASSHACCNTAHRRQPQPTWQTALSGAGHRLASA